VLGTFRYRGETRVAIELRQRLFGERQEKNAGSVLIVLRNSGAALVADRIGALRPVRPEQLTPLPQGISYAPFLVASMAGGAGEVLQILSAPRLSREYVVEAEALDGG
jgi:chemotaxis signal transduction protein